MSRQNDILSLALGHDTFCIKWSEEIIAAVKKELNSEGYIEPRCYILYYDHSKHRYVIHIIEMQSEDMKQAEHSERHYQTLRNIDMSLPHPAIALMFASEGKAPVVGEDEKMPFLLITFETHAKGWKLIYRLEKKSMVMQGGITKTVLQAMVYDEQASKSVLIPAIEKYAHILRSNYSDAANEDIYN